MVLYSMPKKLHCKDGDSQGKTQKTVQVESTQPCNEKTNCVVIFWFSYKDLAFQSAENDDDKWKLSMLISLSVSIEQLEGEQLWLSWRQ